MKAGFGGLGTMGGAVASNIMRAGFELVVHDLRREACEKLLALGAQWAESPKAVIDRCAIVGTMVFGPK